jgi:hypothetical protein
LAVVVYSSSIDVPSRLGISAPERSSSTKKIRTPKEKKPFVSKYKGTSQGSKQAIDRTTNLRGNDGGLSTLIKSPVTPTESSSSEESSSEESEYEEDEAMPVVDISEVSSTCLRVIHCRSHLRKRALF